MRKISDLNNEELENFIADYYDETNTVKKVLQKYNIDEMPNQVSKKLPQEKTDTLCPYCEQFMYKKRLSRTEISYTRNKKNTIHCLLCNHTIFSSDYRQCNCENCNNIRYEKLKVMRENKKNKILSFIEEHNSKYIVEPNMLQRNFLLTLVIYLLSDDLKTFKPIDDMQKTGFPFSPTAQLTSLSTAKSLCSIINLSPVNKNMDTLEYTDDGKISYSSTESYYQLNGHFSIMKIDEIIEELSSPNYYENITKESLEYWKLIAYNELLEYLYYLMGEYNLNTENIGNAIKEKLKQILEHFSVSQGMAILYTSVTATASYSQKNGIYMKRAVNSLVSRIENGISKRLTGEWDSKGYARNYELPQSALAKCFFDRIIKIGDKGFTRKPNEKYLPKFFFSNENIFTEEYTINLLASIKEQSVNLLKENLESNNVKETNEICQYAKTELDLANQTILLKIKEKIFNI